MLPSPSLKSAIMVVGNDLGGNPESGSWNEVEYRDSVGGRFAAEKRPLVRTRP